jgi:hypothetical protein
MHLAMRVKPADPLPPDWKLPVRIGDWQGEKLYYSTDPEVMRAFRERDIIDPGVCPVSGSPLDTISVAEKRLLPDDVEIDRRLYVNAEGRERLVIRLVNGESREGIHRPEWCLVAQGVRIGDLQFLNAKDQEGNDFKVAVYPILSRQSTRPDRFFVYWFEGPDVHTPYNWVRILRMGLDRLRFGKVQRWAYFSVQAEIPPAVANTDAYIAETVQWLLAGRARDHE